MNDPLGKLRVLRRQEPFVPFDIVLTDGRRYSMRHRFQFAFAEDNVVVYIYPDRDLVQSFRPTDISEIEMPHPVS
jgi:hypothetical protein